MESIKRVVIYEAVVSEILKFIKSRNLKKGDRLPSEREMSKALKVSRTSIREALKSLESNNIIIIKHGSGAYINSSESLDFTLHEPGNEFKKSLQILKQLSEARKMIEIFCAVEVSKKITKDQLQKLYEYEEYENNLISNDSSNNISHVYPGMRLELMITDFYGNSFIKSNHERIQELWQKHLEVINSVPFPMEMRHGDHIEIIDAVKSRNKSKIEKAVSNHNERTTEALNRLIDSENTNKKK